ncbi:MAG: hypothetical protein ACRDPT_02900 [Streptomycetales bacterium]
MWSAIAWWGIPLGATLIAVVWAMWASRPRPPSNVFDSLESHRRFRAAMENDTFSGKRRAYGDEGDRPSKASP